MELWIFLGIGVAGALVWAFLQERADPGGVNRTKARVAAMTDRLSRETKQWTLPLLVKTYETNDAGNKLFQDEATLLLDHGYQPLAQSGEGSHLHAGRLILTGGLSVFAGRSGIRSKGKVTVTFQKSPVSASVPAEEARRACPRCGESIAVAAKVCRFCGADVN